MATTRPASAIGHAAALDEIGRQQSGEREEEEGEAEERDRERDGGAQRSDRHAAPGVLGRADLRNGRDGDDEREAPAGRRRRRRSCASRRGPRSSPSQFRRARSRPARRCPTTTARRGDAAARPCRPSARDQRRRRAGSRCRPARARRAGCRHRRTAAHSAAADAMIKMPMRSARAWPILSDQPPASRPNTAPTSVTIDTVMPAVASDRPRSRCSAGTSGGTMPSWPAARTPIP